MIRQIIGEIRNFGKEIRIFHIYIHAIKIVVFNDGQDVITNFFHAPIIDATRSRLATDGYEHFDIAGMCIVNDLGSCRTIHRHNDSKCTVSVPIGLIRVLVERKYNVPIPRIDNLLKPRQDILWVDLINRRCLAYRIEVIGVQDCSLVRFRSTRPLTIL